MGCFCSRSGDPVGDGDLEEQLVLSPPNPGKDRAGLSNRSPFFEQFDRGSLVTYFLIFMGIIALLAFAVYLGSNGVTSNTLTDSSSKNPLSLPPLEDMVTGNDDYLRTPWNNSKLSDDDRVKMVENLKRTIHNEREFDVLMGRTRDVSEFIQFLGNAEEMKSRKRQPFFPPDDSKSGGTLRFIMDLALKMKGFDEKDLSFITKAETRTFTDEQCAILLAASFLGLVSPPTSAQFTKSSTILTLLKFDEPAHFHSILQYFEKMHQRSLLGTIGNRKVSFIRRKLTGPKVAMFDPKQAHRLGRNMREYEEGTNFTEVDLELEMIDNKNTIEDGGYGMLNADFANKRIGGGVLHGAKVQEEISFLIHPECLVSLLFCTVMDPTESVVIVGAERFSTYSGYYKSFKWTGKYEDKTKVVNEHLANVIVAFDAINYRYSPDDQFTQSNMRRELIKAYSAFSIHP
eukprot:436567_1